MTGPLRRATGILRVMWWKWMGSLITPDSKGKRVYLALNKPAGITSTTEEHVKGNIISFVGYPKRIFPIGRLDKDSEGLIFLTNDGDIINKILRCRQ